MSISTVPSLSVLLVSRGLIAGGRGAIGESRHRRTRCIDVRRLVACLLVCLAALLAGGAAYAAKGNMVLRELQRWSTQADTVFHHFASNEMQYALAITQDRQGFLWLATESGVTRWDGYRARVYRADPQDKSALPDNRVLSLLTDERGRLWVGTGVGGLARYDPQCDCFSVYRAGPGGLGNPTVTAIASDNRGGVWVGTAAGLDHVDPDMGMVRNISLGADVQAPVLDVLQDGDGGLWLGTEHGLFRRPPGSEHFLPVLLDVRENSGLVVNQLRRDSAGRLWIATHSHGAYAIEPGQSIPHAVHGSDSASGLEAETIHAIVEVTPGKIWLGTSAGGIVVVEPDAGWQTRRMRHHVAVSTSLQDDDVSSMLRDRSGLVWVGSTSALNMTDPRQIGVSTLFGASTRDKPITAIQIPFVMVDPDEHVWLSDGDAGGIDILDPVLGRIGELRADPARPSSALPLARVLSMVTVRGGDVYIGTRQGLYRTDAQHRSVARIDVPARAVDAGVWVMCFDDGVLWLGGADGLWALDVSRPGPPTVVRHVPVKRFADQRVTAILRGNGDTLWVGTTAGLNRVSVASGNVEQLHTDAADPSALLAGYVASLLIDARGRLWVASIGSGIQVLEARDADGRTHFRRLGMREGLPHNGIDKLLLDEHGTVWASTDEGLARIDPATFEVRTLGEAQGVAIGQNWSNSGARTRAGELLFGGQGGLTIVRPGLVKVVDERPPLVVTEVRVGSRWLPASSFNVAGNAPRLDIRAEDRSLTVEFSALDFAAPSLNRYSYRLQGFDTEWIPTNSDRRLATYTNLPPGDYVLQLRGSGHEAPWLPTMRELPIRVLPSWYQTVWAHLAVALAALAAVAATVQLRTAFLRRRQRELRQLVALRTAELEQRGEDLRKSQLELEKLAYFDPLTGLANRRRFNEQLLQTLARVLRGIGGATLLLIDLDLFKEVNDTMGHDAGDALLVEVASRLVATMREADCVARLGGDEFAVLLAESDIPSDVDATCRRILAAMAEPFDNKGRALSISASVGAARCPSHAVDSDTLYKCADLALYEAKRSGRNSWRLYVPPPLGVSDEPADGRGTVEGELES